MSRLPLWVVLSWISWVPTLSAAGDRPDANVVKVFVLAGQSNMEGKGDNQLMDHLASQPSTRALFSHLRKGENWITRDDVFIKFLGRSGPLMVGFGSPGKTGPELEFGTALGDHFQQPVLLIKTAWGGHSLVQQFRSPSAGLPADEVLDKELRQRRMQVEQNNAKNNKQDTLPTLDDIKARYGTSYRQMLAEVELVRETYATLFPGLAGKQWELTGFVWFQGWNDQYGGEDEYESNLRHLIADLRKDWGVPKLSVVIGAMGQNGSKPAEGAMLKVQRAQLAMNDVPEFRGNVKTIRTDMLVDRSAEEFYPQWKERFDEWKLIGSDHPYHYFGSPIWFNRIGHSMGEAMVELLAEVE